MALVIRSKDELVLGLEEYLTAAEKAEKPKSTVPCFIGNSEEGMSDIGALLEGTLGDIVMQTLLSENHLEKIAFCWAKGVQIPWEQLHQGKGARRISLPAYPFEKRNCWNGFLSPEIAPAFSNDEIPPHKRNDIQMISDVLGMTPEELNPQKALQDYGFDSIVCIQLLQQWQAEAGLSISLAELQTCQTVQNMVDLIAIKRENTVQDQSVQTVSRSFPELIPLNDGKRGRPVFWFHGGVGGVEIYTPFAKKSQRPFYGIQAKGFMTNHAPLHGIEQMASYYIDIMRSVQPEGPYDVGGYSLGGLLAYEVTRQLQSQGLAVKSMVMIDSPYSPGREQNEPSVKTSMLQTINTMLASIVQPEKLTDVLISREEVDVDREEEEFLTELIGLARKRGLNKPETRIRTQLNQMVKAQHAYEFEAYTAQPLVDPEAVKCYYFRNKSKSFLGDLDIYFTISNEKIPLDDTAYWEEWERQIPKFHLVDVDSSNHMMMLTESKASSAMLEFCEKLYSNRGVVNANFLKAFRKKHEASEENADELVKR